MSTPRLILFAIALACVFQPAAVQTGSASQGSGFGGAVQSAVGALTGAAKDKVLIKDLLGMKVSDPGGGVIGTVSDFAVLPGGRMIAALLTTADPKIGKIAVPFTAMKISRTAKTVSLSLPMTLPELAGRGDIQRLTTAVLAPVP